MRSEKRRDLKAVVSGNLCRIMQKKCVYISTLMERTDISRNTFTNVRQGRTLPTLDNAVSIAEALGVTLDDLIADCQAETEQEDL